MNEMGSMGTVESLFCDTKESEPKKDASCGLPEKGPVVVVHHNNLWTDLLEASKRRGRFVGQPDGDLENYRAFAVLIHATRGVLLLECNRKKKKPLHCQLPGGRIDPSDDHHHHHHGFTDVARNGCAREIWEETKIDFQHRTSELHPMIEHKKRCLFVATITEEDVDKIALSEEHSGFVFSNEEPLRVAQRLCWHSGGKIQEALEMALGDL